MSMKNYFNTAHYLLICLTYYLLFSMTSAACQNNKGPGQKNPSNRNIHSESYQENGRTITPEKPEVNAAENIVGEWLSIDEKYDKIIFTKDKYVLMSSREDEMLGGSEFDSDTMGKINFTYDINQQGDLIHLDFVFTQINTSNQNRMLLIAKFIDNTTIKIASFANDKRPTEFTDSNTIVYKKIIN